MVNPASPSGFPRHRPDQDEGRLPDQFLLGPLDVLRRSGTMRWRLLASLSSLLFSQRTIETRVKTDDPVGLGSRTRLMRSSVNYHSLRHEVS